MITKFDFGKTPAGESVSVYTMQNAAGMRASVSDLGGALTELRVPDRKGRFSDVVGGFDTPVDYFNDGSYSGMLIGRVGNRIAKGKFTLDGTEYSIFCNNGENALHGGRIGFSHKLWRVSPEDGAEPRLVLTLVSPNGDEGFPGTLTVKVTYTLRRDNALSIEYEATTDQKTIVNLTNHAYFNLGGYASGKILDHLLWMDADAYLPTNETLIPTGELRSVAGTPFDFRVAKPIGRDFDLSNRDMGLAGGYDHCLCFTGGATETPVKRVEAYDPASGRVMTVYTDQPCVQLYSANFLKNAEVPVKNGLPQVPQTGFCLETQKMPDSINHENFTNTVLNPGEVYRHTTIYAFSVKE